MQQAWDLGKNYGLQLMTHWLWGLDFRSESGSQFG